MSDVSFPLASAFQAESAGLFISPGWGIHSDRVIGTYELIFVRSGVLHMEEDGVPFTLEPQTALILYPGRRHRGAQPYTADVSFYWIHFLPVEKTLEGGGTITLPQYSRPPRPDQLKELFHRYLDDQESDLLLPAQAGFIVAQMLLEVGRIQRRGDERESSVANRAERYIASHFLKGIHAGDVAESVGCHPDYLGRLYRKTFGCTVSEAIHRRQIAEARHLLRESALNIEEVALACGFQGARYFRELFLQFQGISPRAYRNLYARTTINYR